MSNIEDNGLDHLIKAIKHEQSSLGFFEAARLCDLGLNDFPDNVLLLQLRGECAFALVENQVAAECYLRLTELQPRNLEVSFKLAEVYERMERYEAAISIVSLILSCEPTFNEGRLLLGRCYAAKGEWQAALTELSSSKAHLHPASALALMGAYCALRQFEKATSLALKIAPQVADDAEYSSAFSNLAAELAFYAAEIGQLDSVISLADVLSLLGDCERAELLFHFVADVEPFNARGVTSFAYFLKNNKRGEEAATILAALVERLDASDAAGQSQLISALCSCDAVEVAVQAVKVWIRDVSFDMEMLNTLLRTLLNRQKIDEAHYLLLCGLGTHENSQALFLSYGEFLLHERSLGEVKAKILEGLILLGNFIDHQPGGASQYLKLIERVSEGVLSQNDFEGAKLIRDCLRTSSELPPSFSSYAQELERLIDESLLTYFSFSQRTDKVWLEATSRCNLRCTYCELSHTNIPQVDLDFEGFHVFVNEMKSRGATELVFQGRGENSFLIGWEKYVGIALDAGLLLSAVTNLSRQYSEAEYHTFSRYGGITVSVDTTDPVNFKAIRRKADIKKVFANITRIRDFAILEQRNPPDFVWNMVMHTHSFNRIARSIEDGVILGVSGFHLSWLGENPIIPGAVCPRQLDLLSREDFIDGLFQLQLCKGMVAQSGRRLTISNGLNELLKELSAKWEAAYYPDICIAD